MKHILLLLISFLLLSSLVIGKETCVLYQYEIFSRIKWETLGDLEIQPKYEGEIKNVKPNGQGITTYPDGRKYVGEWKDGKWNGEGIFTFKDGYGSEGEWKNGEENGIGNLSYPNGDRYEGEFKNGKMRNGKMYKKMEIYIYK